MTVAMATIPTIYCFCTLASCYVIKAKSVSSYNTIQTFILQEMGNSITKMGKCDEAQHLNVHEIEKRLAMRVWKHMKEHVEDGRFVYKRYVPEVLDHINDTDTQKAMVSILNGTVLKNSGLVVESVRITGAEKALEWKVVRAPVYSAKDDEKRVGKF